MPFIKNYLLFECCIYFVLSIYSTIVWSAWTEVLIFSYAKSKMYVCNYLLLFYVTIGTTDGYCAEFTLFMFLLLTFVLTFLWSRQHCKWGWTSMPFLRIKPSINKTSQWKWNSLQNAEAKWRDTARSCTVQPLGGSETPVYATGTLKCIQGHF